MYILHRLLQSTCKVSFRNNKKKRMKNLALELQENQQQK